jgi:photosystem II stability/assembly factor-like uncharacterized protein
MRCLLLLLLSTTAFAQQVLHSHTEESLRGVSAVSREVVWASGTLGTYLRTTDGGRTWTPAQVLDTGTLDFRGVVAFSADEAFLMSAGTGEQSRIYHTSDGGQHWELQFTNSDAKGFFDSIAFWDSKHGVVVGDPVADETGKLKFEVLLTDDGKTWHRVPGAQLPDALEGEGAFAASNSCIAILRSSSNADIWFATGGKVARVFHSPDRGRSWEVVDTPMIHGADSTGIFSIAFRDAMHGVIAGGDYKRPNDDGPNLAFTDDGGKSWNLSRLRPLAFFSAAVYDRRGEGMRGSKNDGASERMFLVGQDFIFDFRPPADPRRISPKKNSGIKFNAASAYPGGGAVVVGAKGAIAVIP